MEQHKALKPLKTQAPVGLARGDGGAGNFDAVRSLAAGLQQVRVSDRLRAGTFGALGGESQAQSRARAGPAARARSAPDQ